MSESPTAAENEALQQLAAFPLVEALYGRRSRRFGLGGAIPDGPLAYESQREPFPLTDLERMLVLSAMGGTTGGITRSRDTRYAPTCRTTRAGPRAHFPLGGRLPHGRALLDRRHGALLLPDT